VNLSAPFTLCELPLVQYRLIYVVCVLLSIDISVNIVKLFYTFCTDVCQQAQHLPL